TAESVKWLHFYTKQFSGNTLVKGIVGSTLNLYPRIASNTALQAISLSRYRRSVMRKILLLCGVSLLTVGAAQAGEVSVQWQQPEKFTDIRPVNDTRKAYRERILRKFDSFFAELADRLPEGYKWEVTVTDLDLAGDVDYFAGG